jgi:histidyl-tRNA synthetase
MRRRNFAGQFVRVGVYPLSDQENRNIKLNREFTRLLVRSLFEAIKAQKPCQKWDFQQASAFPNRTFLNNRV